MALQVIKVILQLQMQAKRSNEPMEPRRVRLIDVVPLLVEWTEHWNV